MRTNKTKTHHDINNAKIFKFFRVSFFSFCFVATLVSITQSFNKVSAVESSSSANASVIVSSACSFSRVNEGDGNYTGTLSNGSDTEIIGSTFKTICNDPGGYAIYAIGYSNNTLGNTDLIFNNTVDSENNIKTNGDTLTGGNGSYWKMKFSPVSGDFAPTIENSYSSYNDIPSNYTKVASFGNVTVNSSDSTTGSSVTTSYLAYASSTQPAGTYTGAVKYTMVHPSLVTSPSTCPANSICYSPNSDGNGVVNGSMGIQTIASDATSATLLASNFWRSGYGFAGWNTEYDGSGIFYGPNEDIEFEAGDYSEINGGLSLYAIWVKSTGYLQDWTGCQNLTQTTYNSDTGKLIASLPSITALTDKRDNQTYAVARLADGNCWMIENLRLEAAGTIGNNINDPSVTNESLSQRYGGTPGVYGSFVGLANPETANFGNSTVSNSVYTSNGTFSTYDPLANPVTLEDIGTTDGPGNRMPRYRNTNTNSPASNPTTSDANIYSYGNYYTWAAAIADTTYYDTYSGAGGSDAANTSICPSGWKLPLGASRNTTNLSFSKLDKQMGGTGVAANPDTNPTGPERSKVWRSFPNNFLYAGDAFNNNVVNRGLYGFYLTSSVYNENKSYYTSVSARGLAPGVGYSDKNGGYTIRCVAE